MIRFLTITAAAIVLMAGSAAAQDSLEETTSAEDAPGQRATDYNSSRSNKADGNFVAPNPDLDVEEETIIAKGSSATVQEDINMKPTRLDLQGGEAASPDDEDLQDNRRPDDGYAQGASSSKGNATALDLDEGDKDEVKTSITVEDIVIDERE